MSELYTASRLRVWRKCARAHLYRYVLRIQTPSTPAMSFGTHAHVALEAWYLAWQSGGDRLAAALAAIDEVETSEVDRIKLRVLIAAYHTRWHAEPWEIIAVEREFRYYLGDIEIGGKLDALIRNRETGRVWVVEHKTSSADTSPGSLYWDRLAIDTQVSVYIDGAGALDHDIAGCVYDVLKRPQHELLRATPEEKRKYTVGKGCKACGGSAKPGAVERGRGFKLVTFVTTDEVKCDDCDGTGWKKNAAGIPEAPRLHEKQRTEDEALDAFEQRLTDEIAERVDDYLSRGEVVRLSSELPVMRQELLDTIAAMRALDEKGLAPPNHDACAYGREACAYFAACSGRADISDETLFPRGSEAHPELANAA